MSKAKAQASRTSAAKQAKPKKKATPSSRTKSPKAIVPSPPRAPAIHMRSRSEPPAALGADEALIERWAARGAELLRDLATHGADNHEYRVDLKDGRFVWVDPDGHVSAEARAQAICAYAPATSSLTMAWADPLLRSSSVMRLDRIPSEVDDLDEEGAWRVAIKAADLAGADYIYRVAAPNTWYFLALTGVTWSPLRPSFTPGTPAGLVLSELTASRKALSSRAEPAAVVRERLSRVGSALLQEAEYAYRGTDWVARLARTGKRLQQLANKVNVPSFESALQGKGASEWLAPEIASELDEALRLLEDEWRHFV